MKKEIRSLLRARAKVLAKEPEPAVERTLVSEIVEFVLGTGRYGIDITVIREVVPFKECTPLPGTPLHVVGVINVRGRIIPVIGLNSYLGLSDTGTGETSYVIILDNGILEFGILADRLIGTASISIEDIRQIPSSVSVIPERFVKGITRDNLVILDGQAILADEGIIVNEEIK